MKTLTLITKIQDFWATTIMEIICLWIITLNKILLKINFQFQCNSPIISAQIFSKNLELINFCRII